MKINPYKSKEPFLWAGDYLTVRGKIIAYIDYEPEANLDRWVCYVFMDGQGNPVQHPILHSRSYYQADAMRRLESWVGQLISRYSDRIDRFVDSRGPAQ